MDHEPEKKMLSGQREPNATIKSIALLVNFQSCLLKNAEMELQKILGYQAAQWMVFVL